MDGRGSVQQSTGQLFVLCPTREPLSALQRRILGSPDEQNLDKSLFKCPLLIKRICNTARLSLVSHECVREQRTAVVFVGEFMVGTHGKSSRSLNTRYTAVRTEHEPGYARALPVVRSDGEFISSLVRLPCAYSIGKPCSIARYDYQLSMSSYYQLGAVHLDPTTAPIQRIPRTYEYDGTHPYPVACMQPTRTIRSSRAERPCNAEK